MEDHVAYIQVFVVGWETEAEMNFIFGYFNMIELPFVNFRLQPEAWKRYQGWKVNLGAIYFRRIKAFSAPKGKRTVSLLKLQPFSFFKMGLTSQGRDSGDTIRHRLSTGQALNVVLYKILKNKMNKQHVTLSRCICRIK